MESSAYSLFALVVVVSFVVIRVAPLLKRRFRLPGFAASHGLRYRGTIPSDKYAPYKSFYYVGRSALLFNVMEGSWDDFDVALFDFGLRGRTCTGVIVSLLHDYTRVQVIPHDIQLGPRMAVGEQQGMWTRVAPDGWALDSDFIVIEALSDQPASRIGPRTAALLRSGPPGFLETNLGHLFASPMRQISLEELPAFLWSVLPFARALEADAQKGEDRNG
jgi:hypothetical protein